MRVRQHRTRKWLPRLLQSLLPEMLCAGCLSPPPAPHSHFFLHCAAAPLSLLPSLHLTISSLEDVDGAEVGWCRAICRARQAAARGLHY